MLKGKKRGRRRIKKKNESINRNKKKKNKENKENKETKKENKEKKMKKKKKEKENKKNNENQKRERRRKVIWIERSRYGKIINVIRSKKMNLNQRI